MRDVIALAFIADLVFSVQVEGAANRLGFRVATVSTPDKAISALRQGQAGLFVMDLTAAGDRVAEVVRAAKAAPYPVAVLAFGPGVDRRAHQAAQDAGADLVVSRSQFSHDLAQLMILCLDRHREFEARRGIGG
jgi:DNA-binding NarL/FixJ family response regulator